MSKFVNWKDSKSKKRQQLYKIKKNIENKNQHNQTSNKHKKVSLLDIAILQSKITNLIQKEREKDYYQKNPYELTPEEEQEKRITRIKREDALGRLLKQNKPTSSLNKTPPHILTIIIIALIILIAAFS